MLTVLMIVVPLLLILVIADTIQLITFGKYADAHPEEIEVYKDTFIKVDDVGYIRYDMVFPDPEKVEAGTVKTYNKSEVDALIEEAVANRDAEKSNSQ